MSRTPQPAWPQGLPGPRSPQSRPASSRSSHRGLQVPGVGSLSAEAAPCVGTALSETVLAALSRLLSPCLGTAEGDADERHGVSSE